MKRPKHIAESFKLSHFKKHHWEGQVLHDYLMQDVHEASGFSEAARGQRDTYQDPEELNFD